MLIRKESKLDNEFDSLFKPIDEVQFSKMMEDLKGCYTGTDEEIIQMLKDSISLQTNFNTYTLVEKCTMCNGEGRYEDQYDDAYGGSIQFEQWCEYCDSLGYSKLVDEKKVNEFVKEFLGEDED